MKTRSIIFSSVIALSLLFMSSSLFAFGLGIYGTAAKGSTDWVYTNPDTNIESPTIGSDVTKRGLGFTLDTALAFDSLFNYRLQIGFTKIKIDREQNYLDIKGNEYHLYNNFGFGVFRSEVIRLWLGPQIGFGFIKAEYDSNTMETNKFWTIYYAYGIIVGININIGDVATIALDGGYRWNRHAGNSTIVYKSSPNTKYDRDVTGKGKEAFIDVSFMFRMGDTF
jgi:hypothetical protein